MFFGVRGVLTREVLELPADTVIGDPGLLAPLFHTPSIEPSVVGRTVCIPHVQDHQNEKDLLGLSGCDILIRPVVEASEAGLRKILDTIATSDFILTGSLHGAIIACAYGRPFAFWDTGNVDIPFKWHDFASSINIKAEFVQTLSDGRAYFNEGLKNKIQIPLLSQILDVAPFYARPDKYLEAIIHDLKLEGASVAKAGDLLRTLSSYQPSQLRFMEHLSRSYRIQTSSLTNIIFRKIGKKKEMLKYYLRKLY